MNKYEQVIKIKELWMNAALPPKEKRSFFTGVIQTLCAMNMII